MKWRCVPVGCGKQKRTIRKVSTHNPAGFPCLLTWLRILMFARRQYHVVYTGLEIRQSYDEGSELKTQSVQQNIAKLAEICWTELGVLPEAVLHMLLLRWMDRQVSPASCWTGQHLEGYLGSASSYRPSEGGRDRHSSRLRKLQL